MGHEPIELWFLSHGQEMAAFLFAEEPLICVVISQPKTIQADFEFLKICLNYFICYSMIWYKKLNHFSTETGVIKWQSAMKVDYKHGTNIQSFNA